MVGLTGTGVLHGLESSFVLNLIILAASTYFVKLSGGNQLAVGFTSVFIALGTFLGIFVFQLALFSTSKISVQE